MGVPISTRRLELTRRSSARGAPRRAPARRPVPIARRLPLPVGALQRGRHETAEQRRRALGAGLELGVELGGHEEGVLLELDHLDEALVGRGARNPQSLPGAPDRVREALAEEVVDLVAVTVALVDDGLSVQLARRRPGVELDRVRAEAHRPPEVRDLLLLGQQVDHRIGRLDVELGRVGALHVRHVAGELGHRDLHPEADPEVRDPVTAGIAGSGDLALDPAPAEAPGDQDPVGLAEQLLGGPSLSASESIQSILQLASCIEAAWRSASETDR